MCDLDEQSERERHLNTDRKRGREGDTNVEIERQKMWK